MKAHAGHPPDLFTPDGFNTALMICHAVQVAKRRQRRQDDLGARGLAVRRPEGRQRIRKADHALIQPMFIVNAREGSNGKYDAKWLKTVSPGNVQPPVHPFP